MVLGFVTPSAAQTAPEPAPPAVAPASPPEAAPPPEAHEPATPAAAPPPAGGRDAVPPVAETYPSTEAHEGEEEGAFPPFEPSTYGSQLLWLALTFGLLYWAISRIALPRIGGIMAERDTRIGADLAEAERLRQETDAAVARYEQALAEARQRAQTIAGQARASSKADTEAERRRLESEVEGRMAAAETRIAEVKARALSEVDVIARDATEAMIVRLLGSGVPPHTVAGAVNAVMAERTA